MRISSRAVLFGVLAAMLVVSHNLDAAAQITAATISATIKDETGGVLRGVDVVVKNVYTGLTRAAVACRRDFPAALRHRPIARWSRLPRR